MDVSSIAKAIKDFLSKNKDTIVYDYYVYPINRLCEVKILFVAKDDKERSYTTSFVTGYYNMLDNEKNILTECWPAIENKFREEYPDVNFIIKTKGLDFHVSMLPSINEIVDHPVHHVPISLKSVIIDLNDRQKWSREKIADWLDALDIDLTFKDA